MSAKSLVQDLKFVFWLLVSAAAFYIFFLAVPL